jgi:hypothetical protein
MKGAAITGQRPMPAVSIGPEDLEREKEKVMKFRKVLFLLVATMLGGAAWLGVASKPVQGKSPSPGYGRCSRCSCPGFFGSGYTCSRGGCGHHYDSHW